MMLREEGGSCVVLFAFNEHAEALTVDAPQANSPSDKTITQEL